MSHRNKERAYEQETEIVDIAEDHGFDAERAWASDGRAMGEDREVDNLVQSDEVTLRLSAKRRKNIANYLTPPDDSSCDGVVVREDYGDNLLVIPLKDVLELIQELTQNDG